MLRRILSLGLILMIAIIPLASAKGYEPLNLSDAEHYAVNLFLSNFTEIGLNEISTYSYDDRQLVDFAAAAPVLKAYRAWLKVYCHTFGVPVVDFFECYVNQNGMPRQELYLDGLHPNADGHRKMAARLLEAGL